MCVLYVCDCGRINSFTNCGYSCSRPDTNYIVCDNCYDNNDNNTDTDTE